MLNWVWEVGCVAWLVVASEQFLLDPPRPSSGSQPVSNAAFILDVWNLYPVHPVSKKSALITLFKKCFANAWCCAAYLKSLWGLLSFITPPPPHLWAVSTCRQYPAWFPSAEEPLSSVSNLCCSLLCGAQSRKNSSLLPFITFRLRAWMNTIWVVYYYIISNALSSYDQCVYLDLVLHDRLAVNWSSLIS